MFTLSAILKMDLRGIEPLSESLSLAVSPITVAVLTFPWQYAHRQAYCFSSFMIHLPGQSLPGKVSHMVDARFPTCECNGADEQLRLLTLTFRLRLYSGSRLVRSPGVCGWLPQLQSPRRNQYKPWSGSERSDITGKQTMLVFLTFSIIWNCI